ncbi:MAG: sporulation protein YabP [Fusicatenibacter sp.]|nr:sporulation protein YabP [Fusicatenibacter sp.]
MEETAAKAHRLSMENREKASLFGILDVYSFDEHQVLLSTSAGELSIRGKDLHVNRLHLEQGEVEVEGKIDSFLYSDGGLKRQKEGPWLARLFR